MIDLKNICKKYGEKTLFDNFTLNVKDGEFLVLTGASGSGKTTLLNMIGGLEKPDSGEIIIDGIDITNRRNLIKYYRETVAFLFQNFALLENKTVRQNLSIIKKNTRSGISIEDALERLKLSDLIDKKVYKLSGGEQQRVALARVMIKNCKLILADEPTGALDRYNTDIVMEELHELNKIGKTVVLVTHNDRLINNEKNIVHIGRESN